MKEKKMKKEWIIISLRVEPELLELLRKHAEKEESTTSQIIRKATKEYLRRMNEDNRL